VHEQGEQVIRLDGDALKTLIAFWYRLKGEADDRAVNTQFDGCVFHSIDVSLHAELDIVASSSRRFTRPPIAVTSHSALKPLNPRLPYVCCRGDDKLDNQTISIVIAAAGVFIAAINSVYSSREARQQRHTEIQTRQAELFTNIYNRWNSRDIQTAYGNMRHLWKWDGYEDFLQKYSIRPPGTAKNFESWFHFQILCTYFDGLGLMVKQGLIDIAFVEKLFADRIIWFWEDWLGPHMVEAKKYGIPSYRPSAVTMYES